MSIYDATVFVTPQLIESIILNRARKEVNKKRYTVLSYSTLIAECIAAWGGLNSDLDVLEETVSGIRQLHWAPLEFWTRQLLLRGLRLQHLYPLQNLNLQRGNLPPRRRLRRRLRKISLRLL